MTNEAPPTPDAPLPSAQADGDAPTTSPIADTQPAPETSPVGIPRIGITPIELPTIKPRKRRTTTLLVDQPPQHLRRAEDLLELTINLLGILSLLLLAVFAHRTTVGVTQDVQTALSSVFATILVLPLQAIEGLVTFLVPLAVLANRLRHRRWRNVGASALASILAYLSASLVLLIITRWAPEALASGLTVTASGSAQIGISAVFAALGGLLTVAGERRSSQVIRTSWGAVWTVTILAVLRGALTLPGAVISVLLGRFIGLALRYAFGVDDRRAHGIDLIRALRRAGIDAVRVVRMDPAAGARAWQVTTNAPLGHTERVRENPLAVPLEDYELAGTSPDEPAQAGSPEPAEHTTQLPMTAPPVNEVDTIEPDDAVNLTQVLADASSTALSEDRLAVHRIYAVWDRQGIRRNVTVLDADRQVVGFLATVWDRLRIRGLSSHRDISVHAAAEHAALMTLSARRAQVRTPSLIGMAEADESVLIVTDHIVQARTFAELGEDVPQAALDDLWSQIERAHAAGLAHRALDGSNVVLDVANRVWLLDWDDGEIISSELSRRMDLAQALALSASVAGVERAIDTASRVLSTDQMASIAPMLQRVVLPRSTREAMGRRGKVLQELRDALVNFTPTAHAEPAKLTRFSARTVIMVIIGLVALWTLLARMNFSEISDAVASANAWWILAALIFSLATYVGAGLTLVAFCPVKLPLWRSTEVHLASSVVSLVAPAGVGGAVINLRFLNRKGVPTAVGVATVALVQVVQFVVTVVLLIILASVTGQSTGLTLPSGWVLAAALALVGVAGVILLVPKARAWVWSKIEPTYKQVWPRLVWLVSNPVRLVVGVGGAMLLSLSYIFAFGASLWAFGYTLPFSILAITYLASNTVGSIVPSPGGIGPVELALTAGLVAADIPSGVALSAALVYRLVTFWVPIPVGWLSLQRLQKNGDM